MTETTAPLCPACRAQLPALLWDEADIVCGSCNAKYPYLLGIPLLLSDAGTQLRTFRKSLSHFIRETQHAQSVVLSQLLQEDLTPRARSRAQLVAEALPLHRASLLELCQNAGIFPLDELDETTDQSLLAYYLLIHRDYAWQPEVDEVAPALSDLLATCPTRDHFGRTLVLGAGTGRLAWELASRAHQHDEVIALDINPLPFLVTQQLRRGKTLELWELPGHPRKSTYAAVQRTIHPPGPSPVNLKLIFADALQPPFAAASFDTIVTPWFIDQVPQNISAFLPTFTGLLKPGGSWLNQGPLIYDPARTQPVHRYCADELIELVVQAGFEITKASYDPTLYLASPVSSQARREFVLTFHAQRLASASPPKDFLPSWLAHNSSNAEPAPVLDGIESALSLHPLVVHLAHLIDGQRTIQELTRQLIASGHLADDEGAEVAVRFCLRLLWRASLKSS